MELTREFVREQFTARGYVADIAWHSPDRADSLNHHAHVMVPMRRVDGDSFATRKERPPEGQHPAKAWKDELARLREAWADTANRHLRAAGIDVRIDHRSLEARGINREPEPKQGPLATQIERDGRESLAGNERRAVQARNAEREQGGLLVIERPEPERSGRASPTEEDELKWTARGGLVAQQESAREAIRDQAKKQGRPEWSQRRGGDKSINDPDRSRGAGEGRDDQPPGGTGGRSR